MFMYILDRIKYMHSVIAFKAFTVCRLAYDLRVILSKKSCCPTQ